MKNYKLFSFVFILSLILIGFGGVKSVNAANCAPGDSFSSVTGQACSVTTMPSGCASGNLFSTTTGQPCSGNTSTNNSAVAQFNNLFKSNFQIGLKGNSDVSALQQFLKDQGYYFGKIDGSYGRITARAVSDFKGDNNLSVAVPTPISTPLPQPVYPVTPPITTSPIIPTTPTITPTPVISYLQGAGCTSNIGTSYVSGNLCSGVVSGGTVYVFGSNFTSDDKVYFGDGRTSVTPTFYSSTSLSFVAPANPGGLSSMYVGSYLNGGYSVSNSVMMPYQSASTNPSSSNLTITTPSQLPNATVGQAYSVTLNTSGIDPNNGYGWSVDNGFPLSGLSFGPSTTQSFINISGTPGVAGTSTFNVTVSSGPSTVTKQFTLTVNPAPITPTQTLTITTPSQLPNAKVGQYYFVSLNITGGSGNYAWSLNNNDAAFPASGLGFSQSYTQSPYQGNAILGTPGSNTNGIYTFNVNVVSGSQTVSKQFTLTVDSQ